MGFTGRYALEESRYRRWLYVPDPTAPLTFTRPNGERIVLDEVVEVDGMTTPRLVWWMPGLGPWDAPKPSILHDVLYEWHRAGKSPYGFLETNKILAEACRSEGQSKWKAWLMRRACDVFGYPVWRFGIG